VRGVETKVVWKQTVLWRETVVESPFQKTLHCTKRGPVSRGLELSEK